MRNLSKTRRFGMIAGIGIKVGMAKLRDKEVPKDKILATVLELGGVYVKFLQVLAVRNLNILSLGQDSIDTINKVYDQVAVEDIPIHDLIRKELKGADDQLAYIENKPFASGSFGQVYRGKLVSGEEVAIKIIRPSVINNINFDLNLLGIVVRIANISNKSVFDYKRLFNQFATVTRKELNYVAEAEYQELLHEKYKNHVSMVIPKVYSELCSKHVITQEFIHGVSATELINQREQGIDPNEYIRYTLGSDLNYQLIILGQEQLESVLIDGFSHGDPHPGNIMLMTGNRIALLDFGIKSRSPADRKAFFGLVKEYQKIYAGQFDFEGYTMAMMGLFVSELTNAVKTFDTYSRGQATENLLGAIKAAVGDIYQGSIRDVNELLSRQKHLLVFNTVINQGNRFGLKFETDEPEFLRASTMYMNLVEALGHKSEVMNVVYSNIVSKYFYYDFATKQQSTNPEQALEVVSGWLDDVASRDAFLFKMIESRINKRLLSV